MTAQREHALKCWPAPFEAIVQGLKTFESRKDDRGFQVGDSLRLKEWDPLCSKFTGREHLCRVMYMMTDENGWCKDGWCIMSIASTR